ncbi:PREDICTED: protein SODIUM POTASSIUM ROOT DEFECTIVE 2-like isoform X1 [Lupinus angustifolius]|uniref:protein SODIUM POTASSIUM ROOT DEFECTIVE 2-like isoform X1 n=1 Tax=Lupinus angustifolius TaxID=3871 RepID=UPI00092F37BE|nr:PREDICTED: protein SODIUM POTASSIUM ROOT DEFECTIVE 2-like isoform X1 [Lupinus angustifolius]
MGLINVFFSCCECGQVVEVKVGFHCDECIKKILKAIKKIEDIETYNVEKELNKVIVTGNVTTEEVIKVLQKIGKNATPWEDVLQPQPNC